MYLVGYRGHIIVDLSEKTDLKVSAAIGICFDVVLIVYIWLISPEY